MLEEKEMVDIELVTRNAIYGEEVEVKIAELMIHADLVTVRGNTITVKDVQVTDNGKIRFHGEEVILQK